VVERRRGFTRTVLLVGGWAVKVPCCRYGWRIFLAGLLCNIQERTWAAAGIPECCPVLWADPLGFVVVMRRIETLGRELTEQEFLAFRETASYLVPCENKPHHFGWWNGKMVTVDYGS
jgi:hypothetical protein